MIDVNNTTCSPKSDQEFAGRCTFMASVYGWMTIGLLCTALAALIVSSSDVLFRHLFKTNAFWMLLILWFAFGLGFRYVLRMTPVPVAIGMFVVYSALTGTAFAPIIVIFTGASVVTAFFIAAGMFAGVSAFSYITKRDFVSVALFSVMGIWGLILAILVNLLLGSGPMDWVIAIAGIGIFTGLAAYETQKLKQASAADNSVTYRKIVLLGAFDLYLSFINLFLYFFRLLGKKRAPASEKE